MIKAAQWFSLIALLLVFTSPRIVTAQGDVFAEIQRSHIEGNVPGEKVFEIYLRRDLTKYLQGKTGKRVTVKYEPLRIGPTQSGVSYPKYYLWVTASDKGKVITQGAIRVAAIAKKRFEITDYLTVAELRKAPEEIDRTFPVLVGDKIRARLKLNSGF